MFTIGGCPPNCAQEDPTQSGQQNSQIGNSNLQTTHTGQQGEKTKKPTPQGGQSSQQNSQTNNSNQQTSHTGQQGEKANKPTPRGGPLNQQNSETNSPKHKDGKGKNSYQQSGNH
ncbi:MAG: hypothetical protein LC721_12060 [Actinobacteria bacterium]|nr:hypothetical protein [Actinomycetota bacterium]